MRTSPLLPSSNASRLPSVSFSSSAIAASGKSGCAAARAATRLSASGSPAQNLITSSTACGSASTRSAPIRRTRFSLASSGDSTSSDTRCAPSVATSPVSRSRLVTITRQVAEPGSSGRTWFASRALSSTTSIRLPAVRLR